MATQPLIALASRSPRRRELLHQIGVHHTVLAVDVEEKVGCGEAPGDYVVRVAIDKALAGRALAPEGRMPVLAADTAVVVEGSILGKPRDQEDALRMLASLSGSTHQVCTGVALAAGRVHTRLSLSRVRFRGISPLEAEAYWATGEPADKAGAYGIQGLGAIFVADLQGSYSGVMGLPLFETAELLRECGIPLLASHSADGGRYGRSNTAEPGLATNGRT